MSDVKETKLVSLEHLAAEDKARRSKQETANADLAYAALQRRVIQDAERDIAIERLEFLVKQHGDEIATLRDRSEIDGEQMEKLMKSYYDLRGEHANLAAMQEAQRVHQADVIKILDDHEARLKEAIRAQEQLAHDVADRD